MVQRLLYLKKQTIYSSQVVELMMMMMVGVDETLVFHAAAALVQFVALGVRQTVPVALVVVPALQRIVTDR